MAGFSPFRALAGWFSPLLGARCAACGAAMDRPEPGRARLCPACAQALAARETDYCPACGRFYELAGRPPSLCISCLGNPPPWELLAFHAPYEGRLRQLILRYKFASDLGLGELLETWLTQAARRLSGQPLDMVAPIPLHRGRLLSRGFNQSLELSRRASRALGIPLEPHALTRTRATRQQYRLNAEERRKNIKGAFAADKTLVKDKAVLLTDDVLTTGATLEEAARALLRAGAERVEVLVLARRWR